MIGRWRIDPAAQTMTNGGHFRRLSARALNVLIWLAHAHGALVSRDSLMDLAWPNACSSDTPLSQAVAELQRAFQDERAGHRVIETDPYIGYRLADRVSVGSGVDELPLESAPDQFDLAAYKLCLSARTMMLHGNGDKIFTASQLTANAVKRAPDFSFAQAEHAVALVYRWLIDRDSHADLNDAFIHAERACMLRPDLGLAQAARALVLAVGGNIHQAQAALGEGLLMDGNNPDIHFLGARILLANQGYRAAATLAERAAWLRRDDYWAPYLAAQAAAVFDPKRSRQNAKACLKRVRRELRIDPTSHQARMLLAPLEAFLDQINDLIASVDDEPCGENQYRMWRALAPEMGPRKEPFSGHLDALAGQDWLKCAWPVEGQPILSTM